MHAVLRCNAQAGQAKANLPLETSFFGGAAGSEPELLETWIVMAFCDQGTLEQAIRQGRFRRSLVRLKGFWSYGIITLSIRWSRPSGRGACDAAWRAPLLFISLIVSDVCGHDVVIECGGIGSRPRE